MNPRLLVLLVVVSAAGNSSQQHPESPRLSDSSRRIGKKNTKPELQVGKQHVCEVSRVLRNYDQADVKSSENCPSCVRAHVLFDEFCCNYLHFLSWAIILICVHFSNAVNNIHSFGYSTKDRVLGVQTVVID